MCVPQTGTEGSNPSLSAINFLPQYIHNEYIAVFVCRDMGKILGEKLKSSNPFSCRFLLMLLVSFQDFMSNMNVGGILRRLCFIRESIVISKFKL